MSSGQIVQVIGAVVDVEFAREDVPKVYDALKVTETGLTLEVQQQLGDGVVRAIAMGPSDGVSRGLEVTNTEPPKFLSIWKLMRSSWREMFRRRSTMKTRTSPTRRRV